MATLAVFGAWFQKTKNHPALTIFGKYRSREWYGNPANSTSLPPLFREVNTIPRVAAVLTASSPKVS